MRLSLISHAALLPLVLGTTIKGQRSIAERATACTDLHIFLAKGNNEPYPGRQGKLVAAICSGLASCDYEDIQWNNALEIVYCVALEEGAINGAAQLTAYAKRCPDSKLVIAGYSQGGHLVGDILGGGGGIFFQGCVQKANPGLDRTKSPGNKIVAAMIVGDTRHTANQSYNFETGAGANGLFPRPAAQLAGMEQYSNVMRSYCVATDPICAGGDVVATHLNYYDIFSDSAGAWIKGLAGEVAQRSGSALPTQATTTSAPTKSTTSSILITSTTSLLQSSSVPVVASTTPGQPDTTTSASPSQTSSIAIGAKDMMGYASWMGLIACGLFNLSW